MATPTYPLTQFIPAPSCGIGTSLWAVTKTCFMGNGVDTIEINPSWMRCTAVQAGEPGDKGNKECYNNYRTSMVGADGTASLFSTCAVGYTEANSLTWNPFFRTTTAPNAAVTRDYARDVLGAVVYCCPSASGVTFDYDVQETPVRTVHEGTTWTGNSYLMPRCVATRVQALSGKTVTMTPYSDTQAWERRRQEKTPEAGLVTEAWDFGKNLYAEVESFTKTMFGDGHTCYGNCTGYWLNSYTSPEHVVTFPTATRPTPGPSETASAGGSRGTSKATGAAGTATGSQGTAIPSGASRRQVMGWGGAGVTVLATCIAFVSV